MQIVRKAVGSVDVDMGVVLFHVRRILEETPR